jgi:hypothetical protein
MRSEALSAGPLSSSASNHDRQSAADIIIAAMTSKVLAEAVDAAARVLVSADRVYHELTQQVDNTVATTVATTDSGPPRRSTGLGLELCDNWCGPTPLA